jgi:tetratricopeptide (TPR) repeat protein
MSEGKYEQALPLWDEVIGQRPELDIAYAERAFCYENLLPREHNQQQYEAYVRSALADLDQAIELRPDLGDYYAFRHDVIILFSDWEPYRVNRQATQRIAHENAAAAIALGYSEGFRFTDRVYAADLTIMDQCEESLLEIERMLAETAPDDPSITGLYRLRGEAFACLGRFEEALRDIDASLQNPNMVISKTYTKAAYLYQLKRLDEALAVISESLESKPDFQGYRYYLRALIYYDMGEIDRARADLETGSFYTWERSALYAYVTGKIALDEGQREEGIQQLQLAEASLDHNFSLLRARIIEQLAQLGAEPMSVSPSTPIDSTPIPIHSP